MRTFNAANQETTKGWNPATQTFDKLLYTYDGKRAWKVTLNDQGAVVSRRYFLYDDDLLLCELDALGAVASTSTWGGHGLLSRAVAGYGAQGAASTSTVLYGFDERGSVSQRMSVTQASATVH